ncbi:uncharacterized protein LOC106164701 [Lingula anatina]|uniref:glucan endo-1,3-beta-D-glucosidase n=1 Tax=Lingula anatina TaxID=7574 RepID=A0A1S3IJU3_LINAN|nr:uncharacterized protein LOC106164701 [Lingula anatina]|eukprot:XP_013398156.1 uncharacterized protein LOC106164701 [Lingula anatina]
MDRWNKASRTDEMQQQTLTKVGEPWNKITSMGTNAKQMVTGPDGNPFGTFSGKSGVRVGIENSGDAKVTAMGEMYANFEFANNNGGNMEVPLVRGSPILTHLFTNANPQVTAFCLASINGNPVQSSCPVEAQGRDGGEGYTSASCDGSNLVITLYMTKQQDISKIQWAAAPSSAWRSSHGMHTCKDECTVSNGGKTVTIRTHVTGGTFSFAVNVIGSYILPYGRSWIDQPITHTCGNRGKRAAELACSKSFCHFPTCNIQNGKNNFQLTIKLDRPVKKVEDVQFAVATENSWDGHHPMLSCNANTCQLSQDKKTVTTRRLLNSATPVKYAVNVIGTFIQPPRNWHELPFRHECGSSPTSYPVPPTTPSPNPIIPGSSVDSYLGYSCKQSFCHLPVCVVNGAGYDVALIVKLSQPVSDLNKVQFAFHTQDTWASHHYMATCSQSTCKLSSDHKTIIYRKYSPSSRVSYAVNIIGRFVMPPSKWTETPYAHDCRNPQTTPRPGVPSQNTANTAPPTVKPRPVNIAPNTRFVLELNEPGNKLPQQTRKFVLYFSEAMTYRVGSNGQLEFAPQAGGVFNGVLQMAYGGANVRGNLDMASFHDKYIGVYPYKPDTSYCVSGDKGYISFDWNKRIVNGMGGTGQLLMMLMPHHEQLLKSPAILNVNTPYTFKVAVGDSWQQEMPLLPASMEPDVRDVNKVKANSARRQDILNAIATDTAQLPLSSVCGYADSYGVGKFISAAARVASISRAFGTNHYQKLDAQIKNCLEKWLRIQDTLSDGNKFRYDTVWGGLLLRSGPAGQPINPGASFGFPIYADHHFHLGYFLYAAAYYAKYYPSWANIHRERLTLLARDVGNPSKNDPYFPVVRHKDTYTGFSWATGIHGGERQEESSSEAINCYHGLAALGLSLGDRTMQHMGQLMLTQELYSVREYWQVRRHNRHLFPPVIQDYGVVGMLAENNYFLYTLNWPCEPNWFPMRHACLTGIQMIPLTAVSKYWVDKASFLKIFICLITWFWSLYPYFHNFVIIFHLFIFYFSFLAFLR